MAFAIESYFDQTDANDPRYVKFIAQYQHKINNVRVDTPLEIKLCDDEDFAEFYTPA